MDEDVEEEELEEEIDVVEEEEKMDVVEEEEGGGGREKMWRKTEVGEDLHQRNHLG